MRLLMNLRERWFGHAVQYCDHHEVYFPPFNESVNFVRIQSKVRNNPCCAYDTVNTVSPSALGAIRKSAQAKELNFIRKTDVGQPPVAANKYARCPIQEKHSSKNRPAAKLRGVLTENYYSTKRDLEEKRIML